MRIYLNKNGQSTFVGVNLEDKEYSTVSGYPEKFFNALKNDEYGMFEFKDRVIFENNYKTLFIKNTFFDVDDTQMRMDEFYYIGEASTTEELLFILNKKTHRIRKVIIQFDKIDGKSPSGTVHISRFKDSIIEGFTTKEGDEYKMLIKSLEDKYKGQAPQVTVFAVDVDVI